MSHTRTAPYAEPDRRRLLQRTGGALLSLGAAAMAHAAEPFAPAPIVETTAGRLRGRTSAGVHAFRGVPYGAPTGGANRFRPAGPPVRWKGVRDALRVGPMCPQGGGPFRASPEFLTLMTGVSDGSETSGEDCLVLNVWTPGLGDGGERPVMVWLHGGGFATGSGGIALYDGGALARRRDVVVITLNHRLNAFGFLYLARLDGRYADSGMVGMLDIVAALAWIRDNAAAFGGDPANVTVFGESGGGAKVSTLMAMPAAKGLFHRAIVQSGPGVRMVPPDDAHDLTLRVLAHLDVAPHAIDRLQEVPAAQLAAAGAAARRPGAGMGAGSLAPVVDGRALPQHPFDPAAPAVSAETPLLIGANAFETTLMLGLLTPGGTALFDLDEAGLQTRLQAHLERDAATTARVVAAYRRAHPHDRPADLFFRITSDRMIRAPSILQAERKAAQARAPVYMYHFTWDSPGLGGKARATHTLEIPFIFENLEAAPVMTGTGADAHTLAERLSAAWTSFARRGDPNCPGLPAWPAYDASRRATMILDDNCRVADDPDGQALRALARS